MVDVAVVAVVAGRGGSGLGRGAQVDAPRTGRARRMKLTVIVPAYREERTIATLLRHVLAVDLYPLTVTLEVLVCDDGSDDRTAAAAQEVARRDRRVRVMRLPTNQGKGAAI